MPELDGLRGVAILLVLVMHYVVDPAVLVPGTWAWYAFLPLRLSYTGVDLFFVLSGFLIGGILLDSRTSRDYFTVFYIRRAARLFPVYYLWLAVFVALAAAGVPGVIETARGTAVAALPFWTYALFVQNIAVAHMRSFGAIWLAATWSLAIEQQFYLVLGPIVRIFSARTLAAIVAGMVVAAPIVRYIYDGNVFAQGVLTISHADDLGIGVLLALVLRGRTVWEWCRRSGPQLYAAAALACVLCGVTSYDAYFAKHVTAVALLGSVFALFFAIVLVLAVVPVGEFFAALLRHRWLRELGRISYSLYVVHQGILYLGFALVLHTAPVQSGAGSALLILGCLFVSLGIAWVSWHYFESRIIRRVHERFRYRAAAPKLEPT